MKVPLQAVGQNLVEHPVFSISSFPVSDLSILPKLHSLDIANFSEEYQMGEGLLTAPIASFIQNEQGGWTLRSFSAQCFIVSSKAEAGWPDFYILLGSIANTEGYEQGISFNVVVGRPRSKGLLTLDTEKYRAGVKDDVQLALLDYKFFTHPDDIDVMLEGKTCKNTFELGKC